MHGATIKIMCIIFENYNNSLQWKILFKFLASRRDMKIFGSDTLISLMTNVIFHYLDVYTLS